MNGPKVKSLPWRRKLNYLLETPMYPLGRKVQGGDNQQERPVCLRQTRNPQRLYVELYVSFVTYEKIESELHGDMQMSAEMTDTTNAS